MPRPLLDNYIRLSEEIISLFVDSMHDEAQSLIDKAGERVSKEEKKRLAALVRIDKYKPEGVAQIDEAHKRAYRKNGTWLAYFYTLATELMDIERWADAEIALDELIALSKAKDEFYFLDDARLRRALCLKYLGRRREMEALKTEIAPEAEAFFCHKDLGGCVWLRRDNIV
jgi:hypothetical protein